MPGRHWLTAPTRFAGLSRGGAVMVLALLVIALGALLNAPHPAADPIAADARQLQALLFLDEVVEGVRHGGDYYMVVTDAQRAVGVTSHPILAVPLPTLALVQAALPRAVTLALLYLLASGTLLAWWVRLRCVFANALPRIIAIALLGLGEAAFLRPDMMLSHEVWAALIVSLSLALWRRSRWIEAAAIGLCAALIFPAALLYSVVMLGGALTDRRQREALGWVGVIVVIGVAVLLHMHALSSVDAASPSSSDILGVNLITSAGTLPDWVPLATPVILIPLALLGWIGWRAPLATRVTVLLAGQALLIVLWGSGGGATWALLAAPPLILGLVFAPDSLRELWRAAAGRRLTPVTR